MHSRFWVMVLQALTGMMQRNSRDISQKQSKSWQGDANKLNGIEFVTNLERQLCRDEELRLKPYRDSVGKLSIGVGRNLDDNGIRESEAMSMLRNDVIEVIHEAEGLDVWWNLDEERQGVIANMLFNMGLKRLLTFEKMFKALEKGDYELASTEMMDSKWARQVGDRASRLSEQMKKGVWL